jgi:hypothetical protein
MRKSEHGFTLFEVLGAVSLLAIVYMLLATVAYQGLRSEGKSQRILKASLLADRELGEFEAKIDEGLIPELGITEGSEEDGLLVTWEVTPLEMPFLVEGAEAPTDQEAAVFDAIFTSPLDGDPAFVQILLMVSWLEAGQEMSVTRTTFAADQNAATDQVLKKGLITNIASPGAPIDPDKGGES